jgi:organic radical activating enzyme
LDSDDELLETYFAALNQTIEAAPDADVIAFNFRLRHVNDADKPRVGVRGDLDIFRGSQERIIKNYLLNRINCEPIFYCCRRSFLEEKGIHFREGVHEDVDFVMHLLLEASNVEVIEDYIYDKWDTSGSVVNSIGCYHIDGYYNALKRMHGLLKDQGILESYDQEFWTGVVNVTSSRLLRLTDDDLPKNDDVKQIVVEMFEKLFELCSSGKKDFRTLVKKKAFNTKYELIYLEFVAHMDDLDNSGVEQLLTVIADMRDKTWSCYDLHNSVFLAPDEIRTCCKRYYLNGNLKGDVVLIRGADEEEMKVSIADIRQKKSRLYREINRDNAPECEGCPFLLFDTWGGQPLNRGIKYLSLEYHSICNMRCVYCSDTYYGGKKADYDVANIISTAVNSGELADVEYIVWGGGEPMLDKGFSPIFGQLAEANPDVRQRVITNSTKFNEDLAERIRQDRAYVVTSIDAGFQEHFYEIRKYKDLDRVLSNLKKYSKYGPYNIIIKYILLDNNRSLDELEAFVALMEENELLGCNFQISCNFKSELLCDEEVAAVSMLYGMLAKKGARFIFIDDLVWQRFPEANKTMLDTVKNALVDCGLEPYYAESTDYSDVIIWGIGGQTRLLLEKSDFFQNVRIAYMVDPRPGMTGTKFCGIPVKTPTAVKQDSLPMVIGAVQSAPFIYREIELMQETNRVINKLIV